VEVVVGPVKAESMGAFARFARGVLHDQGPGADVPSDAASSFDTYFEEWAQVAESGPEDVTWTGQAEPEVVEYLVYSFFRLAQEVDDATRHVGVVPADAAPFYRLLVGGLLDALEGEAGSRAEFAAHLREFWPGDIEIP
jgi:hypothetical protein